MKRLVLKTHDKKISGLCAGIADYLNLDVAVVRLVTLATIVFTGVLPGLFVYFIGAAIVPKEGESN
jgi:phage shock protein PspC (stress-responsive transcriptional regulator)